MPDLAVSVEPMIIGGQRISSTLVAEVENPATGQVIASVATATESDIDRAVEAAREALHSPAWHAITPAARSRLMTRLAETIRANADELALLESTDTGKPLSQARSDVSGAARYFEYYAGLADKLWGQSIPLGPGVIDFTIREPIGVSLHIVPWNYPIAMTSRGVAPALAAGCTVIVKPSSAAPLTPLRLGELALEAGIPSGVVNVVNGSGAEVGDALVRHPGVNQITFTGSMEVGVRVSKLAAEHVVPVTLELGGKSPHIVFADADLASAVPTIARSIFGNAGQACTAGSRLLVERSAHDEIISRLADTVAPMTLGPGHEDPSMGPLISRHQLEKVTSFVRDAVEQGATAVVGGQASEEPRLSAGYFFLPTVLTGVRPEMHVAREEIFGPVLSVMAFGSETEAVQTANDTDFGLTSAVWTRDINVALRVASALQCGQVGINTWGAGVAETPFGGYKHSGHGREKALEGLRSYLQIKNVCIRVGD